MIAKLILVVVTTTAIVIGYHEYTGGSLIFGKSCHGRFQNPFNYMATKTPYSDKGLDENAALGDPFNTYHGGSCEATMTWHLVRHGTRNPSSKVIKSMTTVLPKLQKEIVESHLNGKGHLCDGEVNEINLWSTEPLPDVSDEKILVPQGEKELAGIAKRFKLRFPKVFAHQYHNDTFKFQFTKTQRAEASAQHFVKGIFHDNQMEEIYYPNPVKADPVLRFYKDCKRWKKEVDKNPAAYQERVKFETSHIFQQLIRKLQDRLGLQSPPTLEQVEIMYLTCSFESAWNPTKGSPWCHVFDEHDFQVLNYRQDIEYYWIDGYGYRLTYEQACPTIQDVVSKLSVKIADPSSPSVIAYFTHSGTLLKVIARLGLFNDSIPLLGDNYEHHRSSRKWRTSLIDPFATNFAFILYKCTDEYKVGLMFQEKPIAQPICGGKYLCPWNEFSTSLNHITQNCDLDTMCKV